MKPKHFFLYAVFIISFPSNVLIAQNSDWSPIPLEQTSYFMNQTNSHIIAMQCDDYNDSTGKFGIHENFLKNEFVHCINKIWNPYNRLPLPSAEFRYYQFENDTLLLTGIWEEYRIPLHLDTGLLAYMNSYVAIRFDSVFEGDILPGVTDSVKDYSLYSVGGAQIGMIRLTKHFGIAEFTRFGDLHEQNGNYQHLELIGIHNDTQNVGFKLPEKKQYMPYKVGDKILISYRHYLAEPEWTEVTEYHSITIDAVHLDSGIAGISGICNIYDHLGGYRSTDSNYNLIFDPTLEEIAEHRGSVHLSTTADDLTSTVTWQESEEFGITMRMGGIGIHPCSADLLMDGYSRTEVYCTQFGFLDIHLHGERQPTQWKLIAADMENGDFGEWPTWVGISVPKQEQQAFLFPNPSSHHLKFQTNQEGLVSIQIYSTIGQLVLSTTVKNEKSLDISSIAPGSYIVRYTSHEFSGSQVLVIQ